MGLTVIMDVLRGMAHIHAPPLEAHGRLTSKCCYVDARFVVKIGDYGLPNFFCLTSEETHQMKENGELWDMLLWTAPEHIGVILGGEMTNFAHRSNRRASWMVHNAAGLTHSTKKFLKINERPKLEKEHLVHQHTLAAKGGSKQGDVYSLAIIMSEIFLGAKPYNMFSQMTSEGKYYHVFLWINLCFSPYPL